MVKYFFKFKMKNLEKYLFVTSLERYAYITYMASNNFIKVKHEYMSRH